MTPTRGPLAAAVLLAAATMPLAAQNPVFSAPPFESYLELLRQQAGIPGMSAAVLQDEQIVWERGFGFANVDARIAATPDTPYLVADISQTVASVLLLQCVEQRRFALEDPASRYGANVPDQASLRQVLGHTDPATTEFKYDPERYSQLTFAMEWCAPQSYRKSVSHRVLEFLSMRDSVPGTDLIDPTVVPAELWDRSMLERYQRVLERIAVPYRVDKKGRATRAEPPPPHSVSAAAGLVTTVRDLAKFDTAIDAGRLLRPETVATAWRPGSSKDGLPIPVGLGWFVQTYRGEPVIWHFGSVPNAYSSLYIKLPSRKLTLILLANSDGLTAPYQLSAGDVSKSVFANLFLRLFT